MQAWLCLWKWCQHFILKALQEVLSYLVLVDELSGPLRICCHRRQLFSNTNWGYPMARNVMDLDTFMLEWLETICLREKGWLQAGNCFFGIYNMFISCLKITRILQGQRRVKRGLGAHRSCLETSSGMTWWSYSQTRPKEHNNQPTSFGTTVNTLGSCKQL